MSTLLNKIVFTGETLDGHYIDDVRRAAERRLGMSPSELDLVFSGRRVVLKRGLSEAEADRYIRELAKLGMHVVRTPQSTQPKSSTTQQPLSDNSLKAQMLAQAARDERADGPGGLFGFFSRGSH